MSRHYQRTLSLSGIDTARYSTDGLKGLVRQILDAGIHGICFSPYVEGQGPGTQISELQIRERLDIVRSHARWIRTFSCTEGHELIPAIAAEYGLKTMVGVWLDDNADQNELEIANAIEVARAGHAGIVAVGNEVLLRDDLPESELIQYIHRVKQAVPDVPVGYVDAYFKFEDYPQVADACDVILANCYPFWEACPVEHALLYMKEMYRRAQRVAKGKKVIVSETGWPNVGTPEEAAVPGFHNAVKYFVDACQWAEEDQIALFYFSAFDESWKVDAEGDVGAYWGLWDKRGQLKYA